MYFFRDVKWCNVFWLRSEIRQGFQSAGLKLLLPKTLGSTSCGFAPNLVSSAVVLWYATAAVSLGEALRDIPKNGCGRDYAKPDSYENAFPLQVHFHVIQTHFRIKGFARGPVRIQKRKHGSKPSQILTGL